MSSYIKDLTDEQKKTLEDAGKILSEVGFTFIDLSGFSRDGSTIKGFGGEPTKIVGMAETLCRWNR